MHETSPYLLQHAHNPVMWYPWGEEAFQKAQAENKPIFLSIGYSTCHWCHVMEKESFEDNEVAEILNDYYVSIKVDKEERPDIDSIYMTVCQALTGSGGWPLTIIMTPDRKPFFAATYIPKHTKYYRKGLIELLDEIKTKWSTNQNDFTQYSNKIVSTIQQVPESSMDHEEPFQLIEMALEALQLNFDDRYGGFGIAPKFPTPHNILFLLKHYQITNHTLSLEMSEKTLLQMYKGGIFDHIGYGFSRYSTDEKWLAPHFEKMLYDNALLIITYIEAYTVTQNSIYKDVAEKTIEYILKELTDEKGAFYCAQDADSDGIEGKYYVFTPEEIIDVLGSEQGKEFNQYYDITENGNFEGKSIPNLISTKSINQNMDLSHSKLYNYRKNRTTLHRDDKILTSWNGLMIAALARTYGISGNQKYLNQALKASQFIEENLFHEGTLYTSYRKGKHSSYGFIDDYAFYMFGLIELYRVTLVEKHLEFAKLLSKKVIEDFWDLDNGGFFLYGKNSEQLFMKPKETYDGAIPSGNSVMLYNLFMLYRITKDDFYEAYLNRLNDFMVTQCGAYPQGSCFYLYTVLLMENPPKEIICVLPNYENKDAVIKKLPKDAIVTILNHETENYHLKNNKTTFYVCEHSSCLPPVNSLSLHD